MAEHRTKKQKQHPNYQFLVSWQPKADSQARVKGELASRETGTAAKPTRTKKAEDLAQDAGSGSIKKRIFKSLILVSFILILELVVYLAWNKFEGR